MGRKENNQEYGTTKTGEHLLKEALPFFSTEATVTPLARGQTNPASILYVVGGNGPLALVKQFDPAHRSDALRDEEQYMQVATHPFVSHLQGRGEKEGYTFLAYEWIDGIDMLDYMRTSEGQEPERKRLLFRTIIDQMLEMGNGIDYQYYLNMREHGTRVSVATPYYAGLLSPEQQKQFDDEYIGVMQQLDQACTLFPGVYIDRNPGNVLLQTKRRSEQLYQVDFGRMEATSPLFDLGMFFSQQTGEPSIVDLDASPSSYVPSYDPVIEKEIVDYAYTKFSAKTKYPWVGGKEDFLRAYNYISFHDHLYFLSKAYGLLRKGNTNPLIQQGRISFHAKQLQITYDVLRDQGEPMSALEPWIQGLLQD